MLQEMRPVLRLPGTRMEVVPTSPGPDGDQYGAQTTGLPRPLGTSAPGRQPTWWYALAPDRLPYLAPDTLSSMPWCIVRRRLG
jgi:hypothetical protein